MPQELVLFHDTIFANVVLGDPKLHLGDVEAALRAAGAWEFVAALPDDMMTVVGERGESSPGVSGSVLRSRAGGATAPAGPR